APREGELFKQPALANTLKLISSYGRDAFYCGEIASQIENFMLEHGGLVSKQDLCQHESNWVEPISTNYRGYDVYELPPNGQGLVVLEMLNILEQFDVT